MKQFDFTPGPWYVMKGGFGERPDHSTVYATGDELNFIATCADFATIKPVNNLANARLIATAPEMLEALIDMVKAQERYCEFHNSNKNILNQRIAIIEKATGKTWGEIKAIVEANK